MGESHRFSNRTDAGEALADAVTAAEIDPEIVLAVPRGGLPIGRIVADRLDVLLDIAVAKKIGAPGNPEYAIGAVTSDGSVWRDEAAIQAVASEQYFENQRQTVAAQAKQKEDSYRGDRPVPTLAGKRLLIVDDGVATGSTLKATVQQLHKTAPEGIFLAVPVAPVETLTELEEIVDAVICLRTPVQFRAVGQVYENFEPVSDSEAKALLHGDSDADS